MNGDERFDSQLRAALEWHAEESSRGVASLERSARRVAERLGFEPAAVGPLIGGREDTGRGLQLIFVVLLIVALLAAALAIGSELLRQVPAVPDGPFGFASECGAAPEDGVVMEVNITGQPATLYEDGRFVIDRSGGGGTMASSVEAALFGERRMTPLGRELVVGRISEAGLTPGCRSWRTEAATGSFEAVTAAGHVQMNWGPGAGDFSFARVATTDDEAAIEALARDLERPDAWLPADAWLDPEEREIVPDRWVVIIGFLDTELPPGSPIVLANGLELNGTDPRYARLDIPGGVPADEFGVGLPSPYSRAPRSSVRCGVVETPEALALAESFDALEVDTAAGDSLHNDDLTAEVSIELEPEIPAGYDCDAAIARRTGGSGPTATRPPPAPTDDGLAAIRPCDLVTDAVLGMLGGERDVRPSRLPIGVAADACVVSGADGGGASVTLYPRPVDRETAALVIEGVFGAGAVEESVDGHPVWLNSCLAEGQGCVGAIAVLSEPYLVLVDFNGAAATPPVDRAWSIAAALLERLPD